MQRDIDVFLAHAWQLNHCNDIVVVLVKIERGSPAAEELCFAGKFAQRWQLKKAVQSQAMADEQTGYPIN